MMLLFLLLFYIVAFFLVLKYLIKQFQLNGWTVFNYMFSYVVLFYVIVPIISISCYLLGIKINDFVYKLPDQSNLEVMFYTYLMILIGILFLCFGYRTQVKKEIISIRYRKINKIRISTIIVVFICLFSAYSLMKYIEGFGSLQDAIAKADLVRSGYFKESEDSDTGFTIFLRFIFLSFIPIIYYYYLDKIDRGLPMKIVLLVSTIVLFILYIFLALSRQSIIDLFLIFMLAQLIKKNKVVNINLIIYLGVAFVFLPILDVFFVNNLNDVSTKSMSPISLIMNEFGFPFFSLIYSIQEDYSFYIFSDFVGDLFGKVMPSSWNPGIIGTNYLNSLFMIGERAAYIPPGIFAQGYYSLGILGVAVVSYFTGFFFKIIDTFFKQLMQKNMRFVFFYAYMIVCSLTWIRTGLPANYFYNFVFLSTIIFLLISFDYKVVSKNDK